MVPRAGFRVWGLGAQGPRGPEAQKQAKKHTQSVKKINRETNIKNGLKKI